MIALPYAILVAAEAIEAAAIAISAAITGKIASDQLTKINDAAQSDKVLQIGQCKNEQATAEPPNARPEQSLTPEEKEALDKLGPLEGLSAEEIESKLKEQGFSGPVSAKSGGKVFVKDVGNGRTIGVRLDPAQPTGPGTKRLTPKGWADEIPHSHKESVPTSEVKDGNYEPTAPDKLTLDDSGNPSADKKATHIPMDGDP
jgi:hypothetical protein